jgi:hypothetical protein
MSFMLQLKKIKWPILLISLSYFIFRLPFLSSWVNYGDDQGKALIDVFNLIQNKKIPLVGPPVTTYEFNGRHLFHGPYEYYFLLPFLLVNTSPISGSISIILFNFIGMILFFLLFKKLLNKTTAALLTILFYSHPFIVGHTSFIWNPNYLLLISNTILFLMFAINFNKSVKSFLIGFFTAVGILLHYQFILWFLGLGIYYLIKRKLKELLVFLLGLTVGSLPMIVFELRHNFYNLQTVFYTFCNLSQQERGLPLYYSISFFPLIIFLVIKFFSVKKLKISYRNLLIGASALLAYFIFIHFNQLNLNNEKWNLKLAQAVATTIIKQNPRDYNVVNLLTGDTQAHAVRYLLIIQGVKPNSIENYPDSQQLYVISTRDKSLLAEDNPWEIYSFEGILLEEWFFGEDDNFKLSLLQKNP